MNKLERTIAADAVIKAVLLRRRRRRRVRALSLALTVGMLSAVAVLGLMHSAPSTASTPVQPQPAIAEPPKIIYDNLPSPPQTPTSEPERVTRLHETVEEVTTYVDRTIPQTNTVTVTEPPRQEADTPSAPQPLYTDCKIYTATSSCMLFRDGCGIAVTDSGVYAADSVGEMTRLPLSCQPEAIAYIGGRLHYSDGKQAYLYDLASGTETAVDSDIDLHYAAELDGRLFCFAVRDGKLLQLDPIGGTQEVLFAHERLTNRLELAGHWLFFFADDEQIGVWGSSHYNLQLYRRDLLTGETLALLHVNDSFRLRYADSDKAVFLMGNSRNQFGYDEVGAPFYRYTVYANGDYTISEEPCDEEWCGKTADSFVLYEQAGAWRVYDYRAERVTDLSGWEEGAWWRHVCSSDSDVIAVPLQDDDDAVPLQDDDDAVRLQMLTLENGGPQLTRTEYALKEHETPVRITRDGVYIVEDASRWIENEAGALVPENRYFLRFLPFKA